MAAEPQALTRLVLVAILLTWAAVAFWNLAKPLPAGIHVASLAARMSESDVDYFDETLKRGITLRHGIALVERAEQLIVMDQSPLPLEFTEHILARKRQRPNIKIVLITDPRDLHYGGTSPLTLSSLEAAGIIVARVDLDRLRDSNMLYSSVWRLGIGWWSNPFDEAPHGSTLLSALRQLNDKADERSVLVADDGAGGWSSIVGSPGGSALGLRRHLARDIAVSELAIAKWSTDDDRLPGPPPSDTRSMGTVDVRLLTEGAVLTAIRDSINVTVGGDDLALTVAALGDRRVIDALLRAAARGARLRLLLDPYRLANRSVAAELLRDAGSAIEVRWLKAPPAGLLLIRHRADVWLNVGSADFTRRDLDDLNLEAHVELHMPSSAAAARAAAGTFERQWAASAAYVAHVDTAPGDYWKYRLSEATGLGIL